MSEATPRDPAAALRAALKAIRQQQARIAELEAAQAASTEPIAIVGVGCRFPGDVRGPAAFWAKLQTDFDAVSEVPPERWAIDAYFDPDPENPGTMYSRRGAFLRDVDKFDARFFGISPREAASMDPQQRLLLETAWEAFEDAGIPPATLRGSATGVYVGLTVIDYVKLLYRDDLTRLDAYAATGNVANIAAGRLSYFFGLNGPAVTLDTACSSSLVAVHLACQSLRTGESGVALAAGVNLMLAPDNSVAVSRARMLSPDGHCKTFDARADGYARGEGCGVVVLKRLSQAQADGDRILALIRGTAVAQDGASSGLTVPHGPSQTAVIRQALAAAQRRPAEVGYLEAHGTGTALGDPIEAEALVGVFSLDKARPHPLVLGSLKTNLGHMESAAGIGGVIKTALCVRHGLIPAHQHFDTPNPEVPLAEIPAEIPRQLMSWPDGYKERIAGISSFGSSGTIAHAVLAAPPPAPARSPWPAGRPLTLFLSAQSPGALRRLSAAMAATLRALPAEVEVADVCWTAATGRTWFRHRRVVRAADATGLAAALATEPTNTTVVPDPDLAAWFGDWRGQRVALPTYPFERTRHWVDEPAALRGRSAPAPVTPEHAAVDFGIMFFNGTERPEGDSYRMLFESARFADRHGFSSVWLPERHFTDFGGLYPNPATLHAALARETQRLRLMSGSSVLPLHDLRRLAEEWSVVDNLSGGRAGMSFASGWNPADFSLRPENYAERRERLFSGIETLRKLWRGETMVAPAGDGGEVAVRIYPTPVQAELPLWVTAAGNPQTFARAGAVGANVLTHLLDQDVTELAAKIATYRQARAAAGHDPASGRVTVMLHTFMGPDAAAVHAKVRGPFTRYLRDNLHLLGGLAASRGQSVDVASLAEAEKDDFVAFLYDRFATTRALFGTPDDCLPLVQQLIGAGVTEIACLLDFGPAEADVLAMLPDLAAFRERAAREAIPAVPGSVAGAPVVAAGWHELAWVPAETRDEVAPTSARCFVCGSAGGDADAVAAALAAAGRAVVRAATMDELSDLHATDQVINCRPLDPGIEATDTLALLQQTVGSFWTLTRGAQAAGGTVPDPRAAAHAALLRVLPVEQAPRWGGLIDLDPAAELGPQLAAAVRVLGGEYAEDQLAVRDGQVWGARLHSRSAPVAASETFAPRADATYLVTGGWGGVGWAVAQWLVQRGARHLHLCGRSVPSAAQAAQVETWASDGIHVTSVVVDVADRAALAAALAIVAEPVAGVFHAAGAWRDQPLAELTPAQWDEVWQAKVEGARNLDTLLADAPLEVFVLFSAFSALLPAPGQGNYAAANAALDALAHQRRARGVPALAINWGPWREVGFAATAHGARAHSRLESLGIDRFAPSEGVAVLETALAQASPQLACMRVDWRQLFQADPQAQRSPLLRDLLAQHAPAAPARAPEAGRIVRQLAESESADASRVLTTALAEVVGAVLRLPLEDVDPGMPITDLGVDSLVAIEIKNRIQLEAEVDVPLTRLLAGPLLRDLAAELLPRLKLAALNAAAGSAGDEDVEEVEL